MSFYIECLDNNPHFPFMKAEYMMHFHNAKSIDRKKAEEILDNPESEEGVLVVVNNGTFEACAFANDRERFDYFMKGVDNGRDNRPMTILKMDRALAEKLSGYTR